MQKNRGIILALVLAAIAAGAALPCLAEEKSKEEQSIWTEDGQRERGPGRVRLELKDEEINRIMESVRQRDAKQAKELARLREKDPEQFMEELRRHAREEFGKVVQERIEKWREQRRNEFLEWLQKALPREAEELTKLRDRNPDLYAKKYDLAWKNYIRIFEESRRSPDVADVLIEDLRLRKREEELVRRIKAAKNEKDKEKLDAQLEQVIADRYDLILRRKQILYERLLRWLEDLQSRIKESRAEIEKAQDPKVKAENVQQRKKDLLEKKFPWD